MAFIQPCFIRKNTPELRKKLEELGYEPNWLMRKHPDVWHGISVFTNSTYYGLGENELENYAPKEHYEGKHFVDCGTNEELFLALAAMRDDSNENQWFIATNDMWDENYNGEITVYYEEGECLLWGYYSFMEYKQSDFRKATVEEIIEHFKDK